MITVNEVYRQIKEISAGQYNPRPSVEVTSIAMRLHSDRATLLPFLYELSQLRLIRFNETSKLSIRLTLLGNNVSRTRP